VVALCDVKQDVLAQAKTMVDGIYQNKDCLVFGDFRELIARKDMDAVMIASTDNWHVLHALAAVRAGKDIYVEKPLGLRLAEDQALRREVNKHRRVFQFGTQQRSDRVFRLACELVRNGHIGQLKHVNIWAPGSTLGGSTKPVPPPTTLDYDFWLGPAAFRPYTEDLTAFDSTKKTWWFNADFALGFIAGWGIHPLDIALWGASEQAGGTVEIEGKGNFPTDGACNTATTWDIDFQFKTGLTMRFVGVPNNSPTEKFLQEAEWAQRYRKITSHGTAFEGTTGWIQVSREGITTHPDSLADLEIEAHQFPTKLVHSSDHVLSFLDAVKSRQATVSPIDAAVQSDAFCHVADIAIRLRRRLRYDGKAEKFIGDKEGNQHLHLRSMRAPWRIGAT
jgi:predicted dehydrogenase